MVKPFLSKSTCFVKVSLVAKIIQSAYLCVLFFMSSTKESPFLVVLTRFLILGKIQEKPWDEVAR